MIGQTQQCLVINGIFQGQKIEINLGVVLVVTNLQAELLLGEPGKRDNKMWTVPYQSLVMLKKSDKVHSTPYLEPDTNHQNYTAVRMAKTTVVEPGEFVELTVPPTLGEPRELVISPRRQDDPWFSPMVRRVTNG